MRPCRSASPIGRKFSSNAFFASARIAASKAAIDCFTKGLSDEVAADNIRVMAVRPGLIETEIHAKGGEPGRADRLAHMVPMKRKGTAQEVAKAAVWLLSPEASYVTGSALDVTGGR